MGITQQRGLTGETAVLNRLVQLGYEVLHPWNRSLGYNLAYLEQNTREIVRVQCKLARLSKDETRLIFATSDEEMLLQPGEKEQLR